MKSFGVRVTGGIAMVVATLVVVMLAARVVGCSPVVVELLVPVTFAAYVLGRGPGLVATAVATAGAAWLLRNGWHVERIPDVQRLAVLVFGGAVVSVLSGWLHDARRRAAKDTRAQQETREHLAASRQHFAIAFDASPLPSAIVRTDDLQVVAVNDAAVSWLALPRERLLGSTLADLGVDREQLARVIADLDRSGHTIRASLVVERGSFRRLVSAFAHRIVLDGASHTYVALEDVTDRHAAELARDESRARFTAAFDVCPLPFAMMRMADRTLVAVNDAFATFHGYAREELIGRCTDDLEFYADAFERDLVRTEMARNGRVRDRRLKMRSRDGRVRTVLASVETVPIDGVSYGVAVFADVTANEEAEGELRATQELFSKVFSRSPLAKSIVRAADTSYVDVNEAYLQLFGYAREELMGKRVVDLPFFVEGHVEVAGEVAGEEMRRGHGSIRGKHLKLRTKSGAIIDAVLSSERIEIAGETMLSTTIQDVTARTRAERALRESEERFARAFERSPLPSAISRVRDRIMVAANDQWLAAFGRGREEIVGKSAADIPMYGNEAEGVRIRKQVERDGYARNVDLRFVRKDGSLFDVIWSVEIIDIGGEPHYLGTLQDITDRKRAEEALRDSEERFRQLAENIREVFWLYDTATKQVVYVSPAYEEVWGRSVDAVVADPDDWMSSIHPEDRALVLDWKTRESYDETYRIVRPDGTTRWIHDRAVPVRDAAGNIVRMAGLAEDISERRVLEEQLRQTQKMESLGMLAGGVAHDFNNLLAVIASSSGMLAEDLPATGEQRELVEEIDAAVQRATGLTRQLLAFSRKQVVEPKVIDINAAVQDTRKMLRRMVGEDVLLQTSLEPELGNVKVDPGYLVQVLMNLAVNARDAMPRGGTLEITTRRITVDEAQVRSHPDVSAGPAVQLSVADTGCGIAPETLAHIFEPFFTTKEQGKGTGMGLAVVHGIVEQAGGFIEVESEIGRGTTFHVYLPIVQAEPTRHEEVAGALAVGAERILLVDDDEYVRRAAARALRARGYTVLEAADGRAALAQLREGIDLLLTDVVMPRMDGRQLAELACATHPELKVLYTSGYTDDAIVRHGVADGDFELIEKPFRVSTLATRVRQVLDR